MEEEEKAQKHLDDFRAAKAEAAPERLRIQGNLAEMASALVGIDAENQLLLEKLYKALQARQELTAAMQRQASAIALPYDFEAGIPGSFIQSLSFDMVAASKAWKARFLCECENLTAYIVVAEEFEAPESLGQSAVAFFGQTVFLSEGEAREFLRDDRPVPGVGGAFGWQCLPPTLVTLDAFTAAAAAAKAVGFHVRYYLKGEFEKLEQKRREAFIAERRGTPVPGLRRW
jgi:hypothetical protein